MDTRLITALLIGFLYSYIGTWTLALYAIILFFAFAIDAKNAIKIKLSSFRKKLRERGQLNV